MYLPKPVIPPLSEAEAEGSFVVVFRNVSLAPAIHSMRGTNYRIQQKRAQSSVKIDQQDLAA